MPNIALELAKLSATAGVKSAYGEKQEVDGVTIVPVAAAWSGFGAGEGDGSAPGGSGAGQGSGGGGGSLSIPLGVYVRRQEGLRFEPNLIALLAVSVPVIWVAGRALRKIIRALKR
ncbi:spore germination protein GerW family protein [Microbacterium halophytorum]|uniref:spore germination protein GerW family protein n=1 Tax=Microbacterium halophytorum TaxID=2067568 RepID=UPI000CFDD394|nr:spore germination protein GerW family protein [Microbacterium halophytorum]